MPATIGLDIHKRETQASILDAQGKVIKEKRFRTTASSFKRALNGYQGSPVVIEAVGFHRPVAKWLTEAGHQVHLAHPRGLEKPKVKTDRIDAHHLAQLLRVDLLPEAWLAPENVQKLRDLARHRQFLGKEAGRLKTKIKHDLYKHGHFPEKNPVETQKGKEKLRHLNIPEITSSLRVLESIQEEQKTLQTQIEAVTTDDPTAQLLMTIPGVGAFTALLILAEVGDFHRFPNGEKLAAYAGFRIRQEQSGDKQWRGRLTRDGNPLLRWILVEAARNHIRHAPKSHLTQRYKRLAQKKGSNRAIIATARSLTHAMHAIIRTQTPFKINRPTSK